MFTDRDDALNYFQFAGISGCIVTFFASPIYGKVIDKFPCKVVVPLGYLLKGLVALGYYFIEDPKTSYWAMTVPFLTVC